ncbi:protein 108-like [Gastrolobium bilobum]|uniref:protein 108-like n=1 Tax=Gastrolobium bilobum TaxID=150636 RepID=UPI002AB285B9|nr:protein 108-like [Gastrolobium bilobum]
MAALKSLFSLISQLGVVLLLVVALGTEKEKVKAQSTCSNQLSNLNVCAPFVVPGAPNTNPSVGCCNALEAVDRDCLCSTIRIAFQLPNQCQLPPIADCGLALRLNAYLAKPCNVRMQEEVNAMK